jgi:hypothetical protein
MLPGVFVYLALLFWKELLLAALVTTLALLPFKKTRRTGMRILGTALGSLVGLAAGVPVGAMALLCGLGIARALAPTTLLSVVAIGLGVVVGIVACALGLAFGAYVGWEVGRGWSLRQILTGEPGETDEMSEPVGRPNNAMKLTRGGW